MPGTVAIVGASANRSKFGNKAVRAFQSQAWTVFPVNLREDMIEGLKAFPSVLDIPGNVEMAAMYVPPEIGITVLPQIARKGIPKVFLNPGTESVELIAEANRLGLKVESG